MSSINSPTLSAALERMWTRFYPEMIERLAVLETAAAACAAGRLNPPQIEAAAAAAHKLAGVLGTFGLAEGTELARKLENLYSAANGAARLPSTRLRAITVQLRSVIASRKSANAFSE